MGMVYLTSHRHTISPCHLMSSHLAGDILGGDSLSPCRNDMIIQQERELGTIHGTKCSG